MAFDARIVRDRRPSWFVPLCSGAVRVGDRSQRRQAQFSRTRGTNPKTRCNPNALAPFFWLVTYHIARNQVTKGLGSYETAWTWLHKLRRAMVRPDRDRLKGWVEVDETMVGGLEEGVAGRQTESKVLVVIAAEADGPGIGRIRMRVIEDASAASLHPFVQDCVEPGSLLHTDGWQGYSGLDRKGYQR